MNIKEAKELPIYLTLKEVAQLLKVKPRTIYAWVRTSESLTSAKAVSCVFVLSNSGLE
jgi:plasmid maintenance system antidote protein VapI